MENKTLKLGQAQQALSSLSRELGIWIVGGTIPEREGKKLYNTCYVYDNQGRQAARHRKIHLFDVNVEGGTVLHGVRHLRPRK